MKFKTNIKCGGCIAAVSPAMNEKIGAGRWQVDLAHADKTLTVDAEISEEAVKQTLQEAGYKAEKI
ncbi:MAG TPA: heavy metal transport/detoxification protein [Cyclobacteriaceae bacterium]|nr:heavy metal transport/detoxification protein [Cyclobacteriaceae bacterium]